MSLAAYDVLLLGITTLTTILQLYVIWLIIFRSPTSMKTYRIFLVAYTVSFMNFLGLIPRNLIFSIQFSIFDSIFFI